MSKKHLKLFLGIFFLFLVVGYFTAPLSVYLYVSQEGNWEWEEYFDDDRYIEEADSFRDIHYSDIGLKGSGLCTKDKNEISGVYASIQYIFYSETEITKVVLDISSYSESEQCAVRIYINSELIDFFLGEKTIDISSYIQDKEFSLKLEFWILNCAMDQDLIIQHLKITGQSAIPEPMYDETDQIPPIQTEKPKSEKLYYQFSDYIRDEENPSLQRAAARCIHGWLYLIKMTTGVVI